jgi:hypothetical protein
MKYETLLCNNLVYCILTENRANLDTTNIINQLFGKMFVDNIFYIILRSNYIALLIYFLHKNTVPEKLSRGNIIDFQYN